MIHLQYSIMIGALGSRESTVRYKGIMDYEQQEI
jgi:hypothetical protein